MTTVRAFLAIAACKNWEIHQMDVQNAFLHGDLAEEVYMKFPPGFESSDPSLVCRLRKSLYGLKQAPRCWYAKLTTALKRYGFIQSYSDYSLFTYTNGNTQINVLVYVDDLIISGNDSAALKAFKAYLSDCFKMKDLGSLKYFLGIEVARSPSGLFLCQRKYTLDIISETGLLGAKPSGFPMEQNHRLARANGEFLQYPEAYRRLVGRLIYLGVTRPDLAYSVHILSQFMQAPRIEHWEAALRVVSESALHIARNPVFHERTKHIEVDCHFVRDAITEGLISPSHVSTKDQLADIFTKALGKAQFDKLLSKLVRLLRSFARKNNEKKLPPGPPPLPISGDLFSLGSMPHVSLTKLAKEYGPLMMLQLGQVPTVIISSAAVAKEALQKNDVCFSSRHILDAVRALKHHENSVAWLPAGSASSEWRNLRKICNSHVFSASRLGASQSLRRNKINDLIFYVEKSSDDGTAVNIGQAAFTTTLNLLSNTFFSVDMGDPNSEIAREFRETIRGLMEEVGKPNFADYFPFLQKIDLQGIRQRTSVHFGKLIDFFKIMINQRLQGERPSGSIEGNDVLDALLGINHEKNEKIELSIIPYLLLDLFSAGTDTTSTTLEWAMAELLHNPGKLKKAQMELQEIIGKGNSLAETDTPRLPYLQAIVKETLRMHPPVPLLLPKKADADVQLFGFNVPKNAQVLINAWAIGRDPTLWENPTLFEPERFMGSNIDFKGHDFELIPFGAGRRICPGLPLANRMIPLMLGSLIHGFDWKLENGISPDEMDMEESFGLTVEKAQRLCAIPVRI
ncbi:geraniol 8-hydroxylase-like [Chenopodium quinoa]|uniref:geraniol 8-hydroxylase-like n=1 Tax=Chenopodium quinoa TaxID=63459 RepID=UPI000B78DB81|nr:geraniol 8-hydroxylase-like [Chenopodium quinoa]